MGLRYLGNIIKPGYNPLASNITTGVNVVQYQGVFTAQQQLQAQANQQWSTDPLFDYSTLLLQADGIANGSQNNTFLDSSTNAFAITRNGNTTQGSFSPFSNQVGAWSNFYTAANDYISYGANTDWTFLNNGASDYTIEFWIFPTTAGVPVFFTDNNASANIGAEVYVDSNLKVNLFVSRGVSGSYFLTTSTSTLPLNVWSFVQVTFTTSTKASAIYINNVASGTGSGSSFSFNTSAPLTAIRVGNSGGSTGTAYLSNFRISNSVRPQTLPTAPFSNDASTKLLACQNNRFLDNSSNAFAVTVNGTPSVQAFSPFAPQYQWTSDVIGGSGYFDGTGDYVTAANNTALDVSSGDFTIECWFYANGVTAEQPIVTRNNGNVSTGNDLQYNLFVLSGSARVRPYSGTTDYTINVGTVVPNAWNHIALVRTGNTFYGYLNGARSATTQTIAGSLNTGTWSTYIGGALISGGGNLFFNGYCGGVRVTKGGALYTGATYTVPTSPFTTTVSSGTANLLLNFTNAGILDGTMKNNLETVGNAQVSTSVVKYGSGSMYFDGSGDYLALRTNQDLVLGTGDFTIECWLYSLSQPGANNSIVGGNATGQPILSLRGSGTSTSIGFNAYGSADIFNISYSFTQNIWTHVAVARSGTNLRLFINGVQIGSTVTNSTNFSGAISTVGVADLGGTNYFINGYIDDLRITKGIARYTQNFIPPSVALPRQ